MYDVGRGMGKRLLLACLQFALPGPVFAGVWPLPSVRSVNCKLTGCFVSTQVDTRVGDASKLLNTESQTRSFGTCFQLICECST